MVLLFVLFVSTPDIQFDHAMCDVTNVLKHNNQRKNRLKSTRPSHATHMNDVHHPAVFGQGVGGNSHVNSAALLLTT